MKTQIKFKVGDAVVLTAEILKWTNQYTAEFYDLLKHLYLNKTKGIVKKVDPIPQYDAVAYVIDFGRPEANRAIINQRCLQEAVVVPPDVEKAIGSLLNL